MLRSPLDLLGILYKVEAVLGVVACVLDHLLTKSVVMIHQHLRIYIPEYT